MYRTQNTLRRWLREPLLHFVLLGLAIFLLSEAFSDSATSPSGQHIKVDRRTLARYAMTQRLDLNSETVGGFLNGLSQTELDDLIDAYVAQEVLVREARALGLDDGDPVVRQRLVSKLQFLLETVDAEQSDPSDSELQEYYDAHVSQYRQPTLLTFSHVFFDNRQGGRTTALRRAQQAQQALNEEHVAFIDGPPRGDAYHYQPSYVQRSQEMIVNHFSAAMATQLWELPMQEGLWQGPLASPYGQHVVMVSRKEEARVPSLEEVEQQVRDALLRERARAAATTATSALRKRYRVDVNLGGD